MILGTGAPRFVYSTGSVDFTETGFYTMKKKEPVSKDIIRPSEITDDTKFIEIGSHLSYQFVFYNKSKTDIDSLKQMFGQQIVFYPHADKPGVAFSALCTEVRAEMSDGNALKYRLYISIISKNYFTYGTNIAVTAPNGSEVIQRNHTYTITWTSAFVTGNVVIELWKSDAFDSTIDATEDNDGSYTWTVPADAVIDTDYKIKIKDLNTGLIYDLSDGDFSIIYDGYNHFDGINDRIPIKNITTLGTTHTVSFWYNCNGTAISAPNNYLVGRIGTSYDYRICASSSYNNLYIRTGDVLGGTGGEIRTNTDDFPNSGSDWHHVVVIIDTTQAVSGDRCRVFIDGDEKTTTILSTIPQNSYYTATEFNVGGYNYYTKASMRDVISYNKVISEDDVAKLYARNYDTMTDKPTDSSVCNFYYRMNDADTFATPYGAFNGSNNYINTSIASNSITSLYIKMGNFASTTGYHGAKDTNARFLVYHNLTSNIIAVAFDTSTASVTYTIPDASHIYGITVTISGGNYTVSVEDLTTSTVLTPASGSATGSAGTITTRTFKVGVADNNGTLQNYSDCDMYELRINGKIWYFNPASSNTINATDGTALTISGTVTNFFVNDEPYTDATVDSSGNGNHGTPTNILPSTFFNQT